MDIQYVLDACVYAMVHCLLHKQTEGQIETVWVMYLHYATKEAIWEGDQYAVELGAQEAGYLIL